VEARKGQERSGSRQKYHYFDAHVTDVNTSLDTWAPRLTLKAKLKACVGKYRMTLARLPLQNEAKPCSAVTRVKQLPMPVYRGISPADALPVDHQPYLYCWCKAGVFCQDLECQRPSMSRRSEL